MDLRRRYTRQITAWLVVLAALLALGAAWKGLSAEAEHQQARVHLSALVQQLAQGHATGQLLDADQLQQLLQARSNVDQMLFSSAASAPRPWHSSAVMAAMAAAMLAALACWIWQPGNLLQGETAALQSESVVMQQVDQSRALADIAWQAREAERHELARELHDEFGQGLTVMCTAAAYVERHAGKASAEALAECGRDMRQAASNMAVQLRGMLGSLRPQGLQGAGMLRALQQLLASRALAAAGLETHASLPKGLPPMSDAAALALYRTLQESVSNVIRHAQASQLVVRLESGKQSLLLTVEDNGRGNAAAALAGAHGGLTGMKERCALAGGDLRIEDSALGGLRIALYLPQNVEEGDKNYAESTVAG